MVDFGSLRTEAGLKKLDEHLASRSYVTSTEGNADDLAIFEQVGVCPNDTFPNAQRWYEHIKALQKLKPQKEWGAGKEAKKEGKKREVKTPVEFVCMPEAWPARDVLKDAKLVEMGPGSVAPKGSPLKEKFYLTTAIHYTNGLPHIGHAYENLTSDVICRYHRMFGRDVFFMTGTDEHGQKIAESAEKKEMTPLQMCDMYVKNFQVLFQRIRCSHDFFVRTTWKDHEDQARKMWEKCGANGDIYLGNYEGWYNVREETFVTDLEAEASNFKDPVSGNPLKRMKEASYFFKLDKYHDWLLDYIKAKPSFIEPEMYRNQVIARLEKDRLRELSISRTTFDWGVRVPKDYDQDHVMYVWFDALTNYTSGVYATDPNHKLNHYWPANAHVIGKDIIWFHAVIWPCMLKSAGLELPKRIQVHGFVQDKDGEKMSKSLGNVVDPHDLLDKVPCDSLRWFFSRSAAYGADMKCNVAAMFAMHNSDMLENLGNLVNRAVNLNEKYSGGIIPAEDKAAGVPQPFDVKALTEKVEAAMKENQISRAAEHVIGASHAANKWLADLEPWKMKEGDARRTETVRLALEAIYVLAHFFAPYTPLASKAMFEKVGAEAVAIVNLKTDFNNLKAGSKTTVGHVLFEKYELPEEDGGEKKADAKAAAGKKGGKENAGKNKGAAKVEMDPNQPEFTKLDIRVGLIKKAWAHPNADSLYCEEIDIGNGEVRQVASGLRKHYSEAEMQNRKILVVCNLRPRKMQGFESQAMVLCAKTVDGEKVEFVEVPEGAKPGDKLLLKEMKENWVPLEPNQVQKKKVWETVVPNLATDADRVAVWDGQPILVNGEKCIAPKLANATVS